MPKDVLNGGVRMSAEDKDRTVSSNPFLYDQLKTLGMSAGVWDDVLDELFYEPFGNIPGRFGFLLADLNGKIGPQLLDYSRPEGISDHDYMRKLLRQVIEELSDHPELPDDDGSDCDKAIEEYWAYRTSLN
jgi:AAA+ ATPase superfamily predicted ATPase